MKTLGESFGVEVAGPDGVGLSRTPQVAGELQVEHDRLGHHPLPVGQADDAVDGQPLDEDVIAHAAACSRPGEFPLAENRQVMPDIHDALAPLRREVAELDRQILELVARRLDTTRKIGEEKLRAALPIRDFRVEVEVLSRGRRCAREFGFDDEVAEQILEDLMRAAVQTQAELPHGAPPVGHKQVLVVGGAGRMGAWMRRFLEAQGHSVSVSDPGAGHESVSLSEGVARADVVVLATPLGATAAILRQVLEQGGDPLIFDICSLKSEIAPLLRAAAAEGRRVTSLHPMFAPGAVLLHGRAVLLCDAGCRQATTEARELFAETALGLYEVGLEEHDKIMAVVLGMSHAVNLQFAHALSRFGLPFDLLGKVASTTFAKQVKTTAEVSEENPVLYHEIQHFNRQTPAMFELLEQALAELRQAAGEASHDRFVNYMKACEAYFTEA